MFLGLSIVFIEGGDVALLFQDKYYKLMKMKLFLEGLNNHLVRY